MQKINSKKKTPVDRWVIEPVRRFIEDSTTSGILLFSSAVVAILLSNSPWSQEFHDLWEIDFSIGFNGHVISKSLHHWINDGLMAVFFFVIGLELKREIVAGELNNPKQAVLPILAALGGMAFPAFFYLIFNSTGPTSHGWGIPMATDIAFALGVLHLLGNKVPISLKIFLTALAIVDDLGAVLVIAFFYTSEIDFISLSTGLGFLVVLIISNLLGVRNTVYYGIIGIGGVWLAFLMSGVHATIAAVLAAMTIPANVKVDEEEYVSGLRKLLHYFELENANGKPTVTDNQLHILDNIQDLSKKALTPLQRLEHNMHPLVSFIVMPIFALSNAGIEFSGDFFSQIASPVFFGVFFGLLVGKVIGVAGLTSALVHLKWVSLPKGMTRRHLLGAGFLASIGFTMSLFIGGLAFIDKGYIEQAKIGVLVASVTGGIIGFLILNSAKQNQEIITESN